jgi:hypothetical protein
MITFALTMIVGMLKIVLAITFIFFAFYGIAILYGILKAAFN